MNELTTPATYIDLTETIQKAREYAEESISEATRRVYWKAWKAFEGWCDSTGLQPLPASPETVALYLSHMAETCKASTISKNLTAISQAHEMAGEENPLRSARVRTTMAGIKRTLGTAPHQKQAAVVSDVTRMVQTLPDSLLGIRDRALLLLGFAGAFRRSEVVSLDVKDLEWSAEGLKVNLRKSKTDQEGRGDKKGIPEYLPRRGSQAVAGSGGDYFRLYFSMCQSARTGAGWSAHGSDCSFGSETGGSSGRA